MTRQHIGALLTCLAIPQLAGIIGSFFTAPHIPTWYSELAKPELTPPSWVFAPVWTVLFVLMGLAVFLVWRKRSVTSIRTALILFGIQLVLNTLWSVLFFGMQNPGLALVEIGVLWVFIVATMLVFWRISWWAGALLLPYLLWVSFASYLNYMIWALQ